MEGFCLDLNFTDAISRVRFAPTTKNLLITSWDSVLRLFDAEQSVLRLEAPSEAALLNCCFQDDDVAFCVDTECCVKRYDLISGNQTVVGNQDNLATCIEYSDSTSLLITAGLDKRITIWDPNTASRGQRCSVVVASEVASMSLCGINLLVASGTTISLFDLRNLGGPIQVLDSSLYYPITCTRSSPNCQGYAAGAADGRVAVNCMYSLPSDEVGYIFHCRPKSKSRGYDLAAINDIEFHPRYGTLTTGDDQGHAIVWDGHCRKRLYEFPKYHSSVVSLSYCRDGQLLAVASSGPYQQDSKTDEAPQVFVYKVDEKFIRPVFGDSR